MNNLLRKALHIFQAKKTKVDPTKKAYIRDAKLDHMPMKRGHETTFLYDFEILNDIILWDLPHKMMQPARGSAFLTLRGYYEHLRQSSEAYEVYWQTAQKIEAESWLQITPGEEIVPSKIRYAQKLTNLDRRMRFLEDDKEVDKKIRMAQTRQLEYLEADVDLLKKKDEGSSDHDLKVKLTAALQHMLENVDIMDQTRDDPIEFEQARASFISQLRGLEALKLTRDPYFTDLLTIIDVGVAYADGTELTDESFNVLRHAVRSIPHSVTSDKLKELRKRLRDNGINILKPLDPHASIGELLKDVFK